MESSPPSNIKCFEYGPDIALIHGALISVHKRLFPNSDDFSLQGLSQNQLKVLRDVIQGSVPIITQTTENRVYGKSEHCMKSLSHQRMHAAILFSVLRSEGICCNEATEYFASIDGIFPKLDWKIYFHLQNMLKWNLIFFSQMVQVPPWILGIVLGQVSKEIAVEEEDFLSALSSILQVVLDQLLMTTKPVHEEKDIIDFSFPFKPSIESDGNSMSMKATKINSTSPASISCEDVLHLLGALKKFEMDLKVVKIILWGLNTLFQKMISCRSCPDSHIELDAVKIYLDFSRDILCSENVKSCLDLAFKTFQVENNAMSTSIDTHVVFIVLYIHNKLDLLLSSENYDGTCVEDPFWLQDLRENLRAMFECLPSFPSAANQENTMDFEEYVKLLIYVVSGKEKYRHYAYKLLVKSPELLVRQDVIECIEKNWLRCIMTASVFMAMMDSILKVLGPKRNSLIEVFVAVFNHASLAKRKHIVKEFISMYGLSDVFKLPYFEAEFRSSNKNVTQDQAVKFILSLCLQSPGRAIEMIIEKMFTHGQTESMLLALKEVNFVCKYQDESDPLPLLIKTLKPHLILDIADDKKIKNILAFVQDLLEVFYDDEAFPVNKFIESCILPNIPKNCNFDFPVSLLNVVLSYSLEQDDVSWVSGLPTAPVIILLCNVISKSIALHRSISKAAAVCALNSFVQLCKKSSFPKQITLSIEDQRWIECHLQNMHPAVRFYVQECTGLAVSGAECTNLQTLLSGYAVVKHADTSVLEEHLEANYSSCPSTAITLSLVQILPHLTVDEMLLLVERLSCMKLKFLQRSSTDLEVPEDEKTILAVVEMFIDAVFLLKHCENVPLHWPIIISSFAQVVKDLCCRDFSTPTYTKMFLELCRLIEKMHEQNEQYSVVLQRVLEKFKSDRKLYRYLSCIMYSFQ